MGQVTQCIELFGDVLAGSATAGNNVVSHKLLSLLTSSEPFDYTYDDTKAPTSGKNVDAARVNAFYLYLVNKLCDIWYEYGFTGQ
jgi:extracellular elastinolytic metalloproteinase